MRLIFILFLASFVIGSSVWAIVDSINNPILCFEEAYSEGGLYLTHEGSRKLCAGTRNSRAPIECYTNSKLPMDIGLTDEDVVHLCSGASDPKTPADCFLEIYNSNILDLTIEESVTLCQRASLASTPINCFRKAFLDEDGLILDLESAIELCTGS